MADSTELQKIHEDARKFSAQFAGFIKAAEHLGRIGSLEQATREAEQRLEKAKDAEAEAVRNAATKADELTRRHEQKIRDLDDAAKAKIADDERGLVTARARHDLAIAATQAEVDRIKGTAVEHEQRLAAAKQGLAEHDRAIEVKSDALAGMHALLDDAKAGLTRVRQQHQEFLAKIGAR